MQESESVFFPQPRLEQADESSGHGANDRPHDEPDLEDQTLLNRLVTLKDLHFGAVRAFGLNEVRAGTQISLNSAGA